MRHISILIRFKKNQKIAYRILNQKAIDPIRIKIFNKAQFVYCMNYYDLIEYLFHSN